MINQKVLDELDPKLLETYKKLGIPLQEQARLNGIAVDAVLIQFQLLQLLKVN